MLKWEMRDGRGEGRRRKERKREREKHTNTNGGGDRDVTDPFRASRLFGRGPHSLLPV